MSYFEKMRFAQVQDFPPMGTEFSIITTGKTAAAACFAGAEHSDYFVGAEHSDCFAGAEHTDSSGNQILAAPGLGDTLSAGEINRRKERLHRLSPPDGVRI